MRVDEQHERREREQRVSVGSPRDERERRASGDARRASRARARACARRRAANTTTATSASERREHEEHAERGRDALAALAAEERREAVAEDRGEAGAATTDVLAAARVIAQRDRGRALRAHRGASTTSRRRARARARRSSRRCCRCRCSRMSTPRALRDEHPERDRAGEEADEDEQRDHDRSVATLRRRPPALDLLDRRRAREPRGQRVEEHAAVRPGHDAASRGSRRCRGRRAGGSAGRSPA